MAVIEVTREPRAQYAGEGSSPKPYRAPRWPRVLAVVALVALAAFIATPLIAGLWYSFWIPGTNFRTSIAVSLLVTLLSWALMIIVLQAAKRVAALRKAQK